MKRRQRMVAGRFRLAPSSSSRAGAAFPLTMAAMTTPHLLLLLLPPRPLLCPHPMYCLRCTGQYPLPRPMYGPYCPHPLKDAVPPRHPMFCLCLCPPPLQGIPPRPPRRQ